MKKNGVMMEFNNSFIYPMLLITIIFTITIYIVLRPFVKSNKLLVKKSNIPKNIIKNYSKKNSHLTINQVNLVVAGFVDYLNVQKYAHSKNFKGSLAMPSSYVDDFWHDFILNTVAYRKFCQKQMGFFLHHNSSFSESKEHVLETEDQLCFWLHKTYEIDNVPALLVVDSDIDRKNNIWIQKWMMKNCGKFL